MSDQMFIETNGARIPALGFGTWQLRDEACVSAVETALACGYRHIDTARMYANESLGLACRKVWRDNRAGALEPPRRACAISARSGRPAR